MALQLLFSIDMKSSYSIDFSNNLLITLIELLFDGKYILGYISLAMNNMIAVHFKTAKADLCASDFSLMYRGFCK